MRDTPPPDCFSTAERWTRPHEPHPSLPACSPAHSGSATQNTIQIRRMQVIAVQLQVQGPWTESVGGCPIARACTKNSLDALLTNGKFDFEIRMPPNTVRCGQAGGSTVSSGPMPRPTRSRDPKSSGNAFVAWSLPTCTSGATDCTSRALVSSLQEINTVPARSSAGTSMALSTLSRGVAKQSLFSLREPQLPSHLQLCLCNQSLQPTSQSPFPTNSSSMKHQLADTQDRPTTVWHRL